MNNEQINLSDKDIQLFASFGGAEDSAHWAFGYLLSQNVDAVKDELKGKIKPAELRSVIASLRQQAASAAGIDRSAASDRENVSRFYEGTESEYDMFSWSQFRALKSAKKQWRELADLLIVQKEKFGFVIASPACIRVFAKALNGELLEVLLDKLEFELGAQCNLTPADISRIWREMGASDVPEWQVELGKLRDRVDAVREMGGVPQGVKDVLCELGDKLSEALSEGEAEPESEASNDLQ